MTTTPVLSFENVRIGNPAPGSPCLDPITASVARGEHCLVWAHSKLWVRPFLDAATGLEDPSSGEVRFQGREWDEMSVRELERNRARIGRVFSGNAWLSNLDLDENILLPASYHHHERLDACRARAVELAKGFGLEKIPRERPEAAAEGVLTKAQWIRSLLLEPDLLLLEFPTETADAAGSAAFFEAVQRELKRGCAVIWITTDRRIWHRCEEGGGFALPLERG